MTPAVCEECEVASARDLAPHLFTNLHGHPKKVSGQVVNRIVSSRRPGLSRSRPETGRYPDLPFFLHDCVKIVISDPKQVDF